MCLNMRFICIETREEKNGEDHPDLDPFYVKQSWQTLKANKNVSSNWGLLYKKQPASQHGSNAANNPSLNGQDIFKKVMKSAGPN